MRPCDLSSLPEEKWDVNIASLDLDDTTLRVWLGGSGIGFRCYTSIATVDISIPIKTWNEIIAFVEKFQKEDLDEHLATGFLSKDETYNVQVCGGIYNFPRKKIIKKPLIIVIAQCTNGSNGANIQFLLSKFKKIAKWYKTDVK
jgi:Trp operon repressor